MQAWADLNCSNYNLYFVPLSQAIRLTSWIADIALRADLVEVVQESSQTQYISLTH